VLSITTERDRNAEEDGKVGKGRKQKHCLKKYLLEKMQRWINSLLEAERDAAADFNPLFIGVITSTLTRKPSDSR